MSFSFVNNRMTSVISGNGGWKAEIAANKQEKKKKNELLVYLYLKICRYIGFLF